jgi:hypothetical protein
MAGTIKVDNINADSNLALKIANTAVAFIDSTGLRPVSGNLNLDVTSTSKLYLPSANTVAIQTSGNTAVNITSAGVLQFNSGFGSAANAYGCRAWCVFNGTTTGTNAPISGGNVSTVTRNSTGNYTINFTNAMPDANCAVTATSLAAITYLVSVPTTTSANVGTLNSAASATDYAYVSVSVFR